MSKIAIIDYGMGNLNSVKKILQRIGVEVKIVSDGSQLEDSEKIILPGVGHFKKAVENLKQRGFWDTLNLAVLGKRVPILGICLGMQLMAKHSEEGDSEGFGWFDAEVVRFRVNNSLKYKIPHIGWNHVSVKKASQLFDNVDLSSGFYFVHSYYIICNNQFDVLNESVYESPFITAIQRGNIYGVQYHPEKSHNAGEQLLRNFVKMQICSGHE